MNHSGTLLNGHTSTADTYGKTDSSKSSKRIIISPHIEPSELQTPRYITAYKDEYSLLEGPVPLYTRLQEIHVCFY